MTTLDYLADTYLSQSEAKVLEVLETERGMAIVLDRTIFYQQGGGQPADQGKIYSDNGEFVVSDVRMNEIGTVYHYSEINTGSLNKDEPVKLEINTDRRELNSRLHSAGHLLDIALKKAGISGLTPGKGCHFPDGPPYIQYEGTLENPSEFIPKLEEVVNEMVNQKLEIQAKEISPEEANEKGIFAPPGKSARVVQFEGFEEFGCGGTHLRDS